MSHAAAAHDPDDTASQHRAGNGRSATRQVRESQRRSALSSLAAELSEAAATIHDAADSADARPAGRPVDAATDTVAAGTVVPLRPQMHLTGHAEAAAAAVDASAPAASDAPAPVDDGAVAQIQRYRAEVQVLTERVELELRARADVERKLAAAQDELRFLRAEMQMVGQKRRGRGPLARILGVVRRRHRDVLPARPSKRA